jgi:hypothetical protein
VLPADASSNGLLPVWVFVGEAGFCWGSGSRHHPVTDISDAAHALAGYLGGEPS